MIRFLCAVALLQGTPPKPSHPVLFGYRLETRRTAVQSHIACMADFTCQPSDSVTLYFSHEGTNSGLNSILTMIEMSTSFPIADLTPLRRWQTFYQAWATSRLGVVDSVRLSFDQQELNAYWRSPNWWADLTIQNVSANQPFTFVTVTLYCQSLRCRQL